MADRQKLQNDIERLRTLRAEFGNLGVNYSINKIQHIAAEVLIVFEAIKTSNVEFFKNVEKYRSNVEFALGEDPSISLDRVPHGDGTNRQVTRRSWLTEDINLAELRLKEAISKMIEAGENWLKKIEWEAASTTAVVQAKPDLKSAFPPMTEGTSKAKELVVAQEQIVRLQGDLLTMRRNLSHEQIQSNSLKQQVHTLMQKVSALIQELDEKKKANTYPVPQLQNSNQVTPQPEEQRQTNILKQQVQMLTQKVTSLTKQLDDENAARLEVVRKLQNSRPITPQPVSQSQPQSQDENEYRKLQDRYAELQKKYDDEKRYADNARQWWEEAKKKLEELKRRPKEPDSPEKIRKDLQERAGMFPPALGEIARQLIQVVGVLLEERTELFENEKSLKALDTCVYCPIPPLVEYAIEPNGREVFESEDMARLVTLRGWAHTQLGRLGFRPIVPRHGDTYDRDKHICAGGNLVPVNDDQKKHNRIHSVRRHGYEYNGRILRQADVKRYVYSRPDPAVELLSEEAMEAGNGQDVTEEIGETEACVEERMEAVVSSSLVDAGEVSCAEEAAPVTEEIVETRAETMDITDVEGEPPRSSTRRKNMLDYGIMTSRPRPERKETS